MPEQGTIAPPEKGKMTALLPILHIVPQQGTQQGQTKKVYKCPLYSTASRAGAMSSTGGNSNFVMHIGLPILDDMDAADFVLQGVAAVCSGASHG